MIKKRTFTGLLFAALLLPSISFPMKQDAFGNWVLDSESSEEESENPAPECMLCWVNQGEVIDGQRTDLAYIAVDNQCEHHFICRVCAGEYTQENRARFVNNNPLVCPGRDCNRILPEEDLVQLVGGPLYDQLCQARDVRIAELHGRSLSPEDIAWMNGPEVLNSDDKNPRPRRDGDEVCRARLCPGCQVLTERNRSCNHMSCASCDTQYCYRCLRDWGNNEDQCNSFYGCRNPVRQDRLPKNNNQNHSPTFVSSINSPVILNSIIVGALVATTTLAIIKWRWIKQKATKFKKWVGSKFSRKTTGKNTVKILK